MATLTKVATQCGRSARFAVATAVGIGIGIGVSIGFLIPTGGFALDSAAMETASNGAESPYLARGVGHPIAWRARSGGQLVAWRPWGAAAFDEARRLDRPVFLVLGVSGSHWCAAMDRENFDDSGVADALNSGFVPIRVDADERPDVDKRYRRLYGMVFPGRAAGSPLLLVLTPNGDLFFGSSYLPRESEDGRTFPRLLEAVTRIWNQRRDEIETQSRRDTEIFAALPTQILTPDAELSSATLEAVRGSIAAEFNPAYPGFGASEGPRFPAPWRLGYLLEHAARTGDRKDHAIVGAVLDAMISGAISDPVDGGLHRYCVDGRWMNPRFEKPLDVNAAWLWILAMAQRYMPNPEYDAEMRRTWSFIQRRLGPPPTGSTVDVGGKTGTTHKDQTGRFGFAAGIASDPMDGDPESWWRFTPAEIHRLLPEAHARLAGFLWGVPDAAPGSDAWTEPVSLHRAMSLEEAARSMLRFTPAELAAMRDESMAALREAREWGEGGGDTGETTSPSIALAPPPVDSRRFTAANARLAQALWIYSDVAFDNEARDAALNIVEYFEGNTRRGDGLMGHVAGEAYPAAAAVPIFLEDQAAWLMALVETHRATGDIRWRERAESLARATLVTFKNPYGVALTDRAVVGARADGLLRRDDLGSGGASAAYDDPTTGPIGVPLILYEDDGSPGAVSEFALGLALLSQVTGNKEFERESDRLLRPAVFAAEKVRAPYATWARAVEALLFPGKGVDWVD